MCDKKVKKLEKPSQEYCAEAISTLLATHGIKADVTGHADECGSWVEINLVDPSFYHIEYISKIRENFESSLDIERKERVKSLKSQMKVDYVAVSVKYTIGLKNQVWNWLQTKFKDDLGTLPAKYEQLDQYHVGRLSKMPAFELIKLALLNRIEKTSFWNEA